MKMARDGEVAEADGRGAMTDGRAELSWMVDGRAALTRIGR